MSATEISAGAATSRHGPFEVNALTLTDASGERLLLVAADAIWFSDAEAATLREDLAARLALAPSRVSLAASHSHGTPQPDPRFAVGRQDPGWTERLFGSVREAALASARRATTVSLSLGRARQAAPVAINRRRVAWHFGEAIPRRRAQTLPNPERDFDDRLTLLVLRDPTGAPIACVVHFTCHAVSLPTGEPGADYPGLLRQAVRRRLGGEIPVLFLQGHCGDVRPNLRHHPHGPKDWLVEALIGPRFRPSRPGDADWMMTGLEPALDTALGTARPLKPGPLAATRDSLPLTLADGGSAGRALDLTAWRLGDDLALVFASGEMLSGLATRAEGVVSVGYANGMVGYIAPRDDYADGGYEIDGFTGKFGLPGRFDPNTGARFLDARAGLLAELAPDGATFGVRSPVPRAA